MMNNLKRYQWWQEEIMLWENQMIISIIRICLLTWIGFADEAKYFSLKALYFSFPMKMPGIVP